MEEQLDSAGPSGPVARLRWYAERGFELDLNAVVDRIVLVLVAVPLPVDGTAELFAGQHELDKLEILFKAQVDVDGAPGQLTEAFVTFSPSGSVSLAAEVEDAETGDRFDVKVDVDLEIPTNAPAHGGPRPKPADEAELDWDDEDTHEAFFKDPLTQEDPLPVAQLRREISPAAEEKAAAPAGPGSGAGLERLLQALISGGVDEPEAELEPQVEPPSSDEGAAPAPVRDPADAAGLLRYLVGNEALELEDGYEVDELIPGAAPILAARGSASEKADSLTQWLFTQDAVAELYIGDDDLAALIDRW